MYICIDVYVCMYVYVHMYVCIYANASSILGDDPLTAAVFQTFSGVYGCFIPYYH
jgi:hypothetical protein